MSAARTIAGGIDRLSAVLNRVALVVAVLAVLVMLASASWQVFARYLLDQPPPWTEELSRYSMVWGGMLGASCAYRMKADPTLFPEMVTLGGGIGLVAVLIRSLGAAIFIVATLWFCIFGGGMEIGRGYIARLVSRSAETMDVSMAVFGIAIPIACVLVLLHVLADIARALFPADALAAHGRPDETVPPLTENAL
ncbi:TRAP transporter small permease [Acidimangrovimonas sediminis]|uniref:TRAP transporter small permease n=1 Tax=Acidimangrovimonas sediminis TaxID=2056283 RepID=UPI000C804A34|nr:TRAP transporter small permease [Acidimangrovimonas sediminis]